MSSPFSSLENASLVFPVSSQQMEVDEWGNFAPVAGELTVRCWLSATTLSGQKAVSDVVLPGVDESAQNLKGYCIDPMFLPDYITHGSEALATIGNTKGRFTLYRGLDGISTSVTGSPLSGVFRRQI